MSKEKIENIDYLDSPIGLIKIIELENKIIYIDFAKKKINDFNLTPGIQEVKKQLKEYFLHKRKIFDLPLSIEGTDFQKKVYETLQTIPYGKKVTYKELAKLSGYPNAARAAGTTMAKNRFVIVIPCHRVIKSNGDLGNYNSGSDKKAWLLDHETSFDKNSPV